MRTITILPDPNCWIIVLTLLGVSAIIFGIFAYFFSKALSLHAKARVERKSKEILEID